MSNYAIMRWAKVKFDGVAGAEYHQRTELHKNCEHPEMQPLNLTVRKFEDETLRATTKKIMEAQQERTGRRVRKDATVMVEFVMTFSPEMVGEVNMEEWLRANVDWLRREFGADNLLRYDLHLHEATPHLHAFVSPRDERGNLNFRKYGKHISQLVQLQDRYAKAMEPFGLERGKTRWAELDNGKMKATSEVIRHKPLRAWRSELLQEIQQMEEQLKMVPELNEAQEKALKELETLEHTITQRQGTKKKLDSDVQNLQQTVDNLTGKKTALRNDIVRLQQEQVKEQERYSKLKKQAEAMSKKVDQLRRELVENVLGDSHFTTPPEHQGHLRGADDVLGL